MYKCAYNSQESATYPDQAASIVALAGHIILCRWTRHLTLTMPPSILFSGGNPAMD